MTLQKDVSERKEIEAYLLKLSGMVGRKARKHRYMGKTVSLIIHYTDFETCSRQSALPEFTSDTHDIYSGATGLLRAIRLKDKIRLLGVSLSTLINDPHQISLIEQERKRKAVLKAMDDVNDKFGEFKITWGSYIEQGKEAGVISPSWRPSGVKSVHLR